MSYLGGFLNSMNNGRGIQTHGSVEDLIRATLGNRFSEAPVSKPQEIQNSSSNINEVFTPQKPVVNEEPPKKVAPYQFPDESPELTPFQKSLLGVSEPGLPQNKEREIKKPISEPVKEIQPKYIPPKQEPEPEQFVRRPKDYIFHRDLDEVFECVVTVDGGSSNNAISRLVLKTDMWNLVFEGTIKKDGTCVVPIKKLSILPEGTTGKVCLEVIVDDVLFIPWESSFMVSMSKRVSIQTPSLNRTKNV